MTKELAKTLATALVQFIDRERQEGTMDCSSYECEKIEKAFEGGMYDEVENLIKKKLTGLTEFEQELSWIICEWGNSEETKISNFVKKYAPKLLAITKKDFLKVWNENMKAEYERGKRDGITIGYNKAMKEYNESVAYHFPNMPVNPSGWGCDGTHCTNPQMDCVNCPRKTTGGTFTTQSGTSTLKAEGNTSVTDGKPHNPSFTD